MKKQVDDKVRAAFVEGYSQKAAELRLPAELADIGPQVHDTVVKLAKKADPSELVDMDKWLADYLLPTTMGAYRSGQVAGLGEAAGDEDVPFSVEHPVTHTALGMGAGGLAGSLGGAGLSMALGAKPHTGGLVGLGLGMTGGSILATLARRKRMKEALETVKDRLEAGEELDPERIRRTSGLASVLLPLGGFHVRGRGSAAREVAGMEPGSIPYAGATVSEVLSRIPHVGLLASLPAYTYQGFKGKSDIRKALERARGE